MSQKEVILLGVIWMVTLCMGKMSLVFFAFICIGLNQILLAESASTNVCNKSLKLDNMIVLGIILMLVGGWIFYMGEERSCLLMTIGTIINFLGIGILMSAC